MMYILLAVLASGSGAWSEIQDLMRNQSWHKWQHEHAVKAHATTRRRRWGSIRMTTPTSPQTAKLRIINGGTAPIYIDYQAKHKYWAQNQKINPGQAADYTIPSGYIPGTRFWPKAGCDASGQNCLMGESGGPGLGCPYGGCSPPIDSLFEATFNAHGTDWYDASQVDGWTLPYHFAFRCGSKVKELNCQGLSEKICPSQDIDGIGWTNLVAKNPQKNNQYAGCYSPCAKLTYGNWGNRPGGHRVFSPGSSPADKYCCAGPLARPGPCKKGPAGGMTYTKVVHSHCDAYAWAYDDAVGLQTCNTNKVSYTLTFYSP